MQTTTQTQRQAIYHGLRVGLDQFALPCPRLLAGLAGDFDPTDVIDAAGLAVSFIDLLDPEVDLDRLQEWHDRQVASYELSPAKHASDRSPRPKPFDKYDDYFGLRRVDHSIALTSLVLSLVGAFLVVARFAIASGSPTSRLSLAVLTTTLITSLDVVASQ